MRNPETSPEGSALDPDEPDERTIDRRRVRPSAAWNLSVITAVAAADDAAKAAAEAAAIPATVTRPQDTMPHRTAHDPRPHDHPRRILRKGAAQTRG